MSMRFDEKNNCLIFDIPNSEAAIKAQHNGINDRSVGQYYMSERYDFCYSFLNELKGDFYLDILLSAKNSEEVLNILTEKRLESAFKKELKPQFQKLDALKRFLSEGDYFIPIDVPTINDNKKYLKFNNTDVNFSVIKSLLLGDLMSLAIKKVGMNGFIVYIDKQPDFEAKINSSTIYNWIE